MTDIWEAPTPDVLQPFAGMVVRLNDDRVFRVVDVVEHKITWENGKETFVKWGPENDRLSETMTALGIKRGDISKTIWAVQPRPKQGGWSKSRKGWSDMCWNEMMINYQAEVLQGGL